MRASSSRVVTSACSAPYLLIWKYSVPVVAVGDQPTRTSTRHSPFVLCQTAPALTSPTLSSQVRGDISPTGDLHRVPNVCSTVGVEWTWVWDVTIIFDRATPHPVYRWSRILVVDSPAELRDVVLDARRDPRVARYEYRRRPYLAGEPPATCPAGHTWSTEPSASPAYWHRCQCGGHQALRCTPCDRWLLDPPLSTSCEPFDPRTYSRWRWV